MSTKSTSSSKSAWLSAVLKTRKAATKRHRSSEDSSSKRATYRSRTKTRKSDSLKHSPSESDPTPAPPSPPRSRKSRTKPSTSYGSPTDDYTYITSDSSNNNDEPRSPLTSARTTNHYTSTPGFHQLIEKVSPTNHSTSSKKIYPCRSPPHSRISRTQPSPIHHYFSEDFSDISNGDHEPRSPLTSAQTKNCSDAKIRGGTSTNPSPPSENKNPTRSPSRSPFHSSMSRTKLPSAHHSSSEDSSDSSEGNDEPQTHQTSSKIKNRNDAKIIGGDSTHLTPSSERYNPSRSSSRSRSSRMKLSPTYHVSSEDSSDNSNGDDEARIPQASAKTKNRSTSPASGYTRIRKATGTNYVSSVPRYCGNDIETPPPINSVKRSNYNATLSLSEDSTMHLSCSDDESHSLLNSARNTNHFTLSSPNSPLEHVSEQSSHYTNGDIKSCCPTTNAPPIESFPSKDTLIISNCDEAPSITQNSSDIFSCSTIDESLLTSAQTTNHSTTLSQSHTGTNHSLLLLEALSDRSSHCITSNAQSVGPFPLIDTVNRTNYNAALDTRTLSEEDIITKLQSLDASLSSKVGKLQDLHSSLAFKTEREAISAQPSTHSAQPIQSYTLKDNVEPIFLDINQNVEEDIMIKLLNANASLASKIERRNNIIFGLEDDKRSVESISELQLTRISKLENKLIEATNEVNELKTKQQRPVDEEKSRENYTGHSDCLEVISFSEDTTAACCISTDEKSLQATALFTQECADLTSRLETVKATSYKLKNRVFELESEARISHEKMLSLQDSIEFKETKRQIEDVSSIQSLRDQVSRIFMEKNILTNIMETQLGGKQFKIRKLQDTIKNLSEKISTMEKCHIYEIEELGRSHTNTVSDLEDAIKREQLADIEQRSLSIKHLRNEISSLTSGQLNMESKYSKLLKLLKNEQSTAAERINTLNTQIECMEKENSKVIATLCSKYALLEHNLEEVKNGSKAQKGIILELELEKKEYENFSSKHKRIEQDLTSDLKKTVDEREKFEQETHGLKTCVQQLRAERINIVSKHDQEKKIYKLVALDDINQVEAEKKVIISKYELKQKGYEQEKLKTEEEIQELTEILEEKENELNQSGLIMFKSFMCNKT